MEEDALMEHVIVHQDLKENIVSRNHVSMIVLDMVYVKIILVYVKKIISELIVL
jgi:hypothetical protein